MRQRSRGGSTAVAELDRSRYRRLLIAVLAVALFAALVAMPLVGLPVGKAEGFSSLGDDAAEVASVRLGDGTDLADVTDQNNQDDQGTGGFAQDAAVPDGVEPDGWQAELPAAGDQLPLLAQADSSLQADSLPQIPQHQTPPVVPQGPTPPVVHQQQTRAVSEDLATAGQPLTAADVGAGGTPLDQPTPDQAEGASTARSSSRGRSSTLGKPRGTSGAGLKGMLTQVDQDVLVLDETSDNREYYEQLTQIRGDGPGGVIYGALLRVMSPPPGGFWGLFGLVRAVTGWSQPTRYARSNGVQQPNPATGYAATR
jgi:hypothetical protein